MLSDETVIATIATIANGKYEPICVNARRQTRFPRPPTPNPYRKGILISSFGSSDEEDMEEVELKEITKRFADAEFENLELPTILELPTSELDDGELTEVVVLPNDLMTETTQDGEEQKQPGQQAGPILNEPSDAQMGQVTPCMIGWGPGSDTLCTHFLGFALSVIFWIFVITVGFFIVSGIFGEEDGHDQGVKKNTTADIIADAHGLNSHFAGLLDDMTE